MKYCIVKLFPHDTPQANNGVGYYTHSTLINLVILNNHVLVEEKNIDRETILLISICTLSSVPLLKRYRKQYPDNIIITGGQFAYHFPALLVFSDYVNVGQGFEFFECKTLAQIEKLKCIAFAGKNEIIEPSEKIDWEKFPVAQTKIKHFYYMYSVGCRNKCAFCFTSWANRLQSNDPRRVRVVTEKIKKLKSSVTLISNEYDENFEVSVKDMMLKQYIKTQLIKGKNPKLIRLGIEFPNEDLRKKYGKPFTNEQFYFALDKAAAENKDLNLFFISGLYPLTEIEDLLKNYQQYLTKPRIFVKLTNVVFTQFTPIWHERKNINIENFTTAKYKKYLKDMLDNYGGWRWSILNTANPQKALYETAMNHVTNIDEYEIARKIGSIADPYESFELMTNSGILNNDFRPLIKFWHEDHPGYVKIFKKFENNK